MQPLSGPRYSTVCIVALAFGCGPAVRQPSGEQGDSGTGTDTNESSSGDVGGAASVGGSDPVTSDAPRPGTTSTTSSTSSSSSGEPICPCGPPSLDLVWKADYTRGFSSGFTDFGTSITPGGHVWALRSPLPGREDQPLALLHSTPGGEVETAELADLVDLVDLESSSIHRLAASDSGVAIAAEAANGQTDLHLFTPELTYACAVSTELGFEALFGQEDGSWVLTDETDVVRVEGCGGAQQAWPAVIGIEDSVGLARFDAEGLWLLGFDNAPKLPGALWFVRRYQAGQFEPSLSQELRTFLLPGTHESIVFDGTTAYFANSAFNGSAKVNVLDVETGAHETHSIDMLADGLAIAPLEVVLDNGEAWVVLGLYGEFEVHPIGDGCCGASIQILSSGGLRAARLHEGELIVEGGGPGFAPRRFTLE